MKIASRILLGFSLVVLLIGALGALNFWGSLRGVETVDSLETQSKRLSRVYALDRQVIELQRNAQIFANTGHPAHAKRVADDDKKIGQALDSLRKLIESEEELAIHAQLVQFRTKYREAFARLVEDRERRDRLLDETRLMGAGIRQQLRKRTLNGDRMRAASAAIAFAEAYRAAALYVDRPDSMHVRVAKTALRSSIDDLEAVGRADLALDIQAYETSFVQMVQAIRGYLFLSNVVLAGQALEFATNTAELKSLFEEDQREMVAKLQRDNSWTVTNSIVSVFGALVIGIFASGLIARSIVNPLQAITSTFGALARGESVEEVPGLGRLDEVGEMATAAQVFKERNEQTQKLLKASDLDRRRLADQALELKNANAELEQFAYIASHDMQEPLRMVSSYVGLLGERYKGQLDDEADLFIRFASEGAGRMQHLITDLLDFSRAGNLSEKDFESCDTRVILDSVLLDLQAALTERKASCSIGDLPVIHSHASSLRSIFQNLVSNAAKYGRPGVDLELEINAVEEGENWKFSFRDNGIGIAPQHQERVFKIFQRLHARSDYEGTGIGLAVVSKLVDQLGGRVWLESEVDEGTTFYVSIGQG